MKKDFNKNLFYCYFCKMEIILKINLEKKLICNNCGGKIFYKKYGVGIKKIS